VQPDADETCSDGQLLRVKVPKEGSTPHGGSIGYLVDGRRDDNLLERQSGRLASDAIMGGLPFAFAEPDRLILRHRLKF
jgi:hypothetical protein